MKKLIILLVFFGFYSTQVIGSNELLNKTSKIDYLINVWEYQIPEIRKNPTIDLLRGKLQELSFGQLDLLMDAATFEEFVNTLDSLHSSSRFQSESSTLQDQLLSGISAVGAGPFSYYPLTPCRIVDTRASTGGFAGIMSNGVSRDFFATGAGNITSQGGNSSGCNVPGTAAAVVMNVTSANQTGNGYINIYPAGESEPFTSIVNYRLGVPLANSVIVPICTGSCTADFTSISRIASSHLIIDVLGYFE